MHHIRRAPNSRGYLRGRDVPIDVVDIISIIVTLLFAVRYAMAPADEEHRFRHGKAEALAGLARALLILGPIGLLLSQTVGRLCDPVMVENSAIGISVMIASMVLICARVFL